MKINLVNPPRSFIDRSEIAPPLGLLRLAGAGISAGIDVSLTDFNLLYHEDPLLSDPRLFYSTAIQYLLDTQADVHCFTSMAVDTHVAIHLARLLKTERPEVIVMVGGTHFSAIAAEIVDNYPWIDHVVTGEGEDVIRRLPSLLREKGRHSVISGKPFAPEAGEKLPFHIVDLEAYFDVNENRLLNFESGRGCRFKCAFCYSPGHYKGFRNFSVNETIDELKRAQELGFRDVFFVDDNFLNDSAYAERFCKEIRDSRLALNWHCYATFPYISSEIIRTMADAGCTAVFAGIDAIGGDSRRAFRKSFVREADVLRERIFELVENNIIPTCAFLLTPPSCKGGNDLEETLYFALVARNAGAHVRLNTLTLYNKTRSTREASNYIDYDEFKALLMLDVPEFVEMNRYAIARPELFPFHSRYVGLREWHNFISLSHCLFTLYESYPATLDHLWKVENMSPAKIAYSILDNVEPLVGIPKTERRDAQLLEAIKVFQKLSLKDYRLQTVLEKESASILSIQTL